MFEIINAGREHTPLGRRQGAQTQQRSGPAKKPVPTKQTLPGPITPGRRRVPRPEPQQGPAEGGTP